MTSPGPAFQECTGSCHENGPTPKAVSSDLRSTDGLTVLARIEIVTILVHYQPSYNTSHTMKPSDPLLLTDVTLHCGMYPAGKVAISRHLATSWFPQYQIMICIFCTNYSFFISLLGINSNQFPTIIFKLVWKLSLLAHNQ